MPGSVRRRGNSWTVTLDLGTDPGTGKRRQLTRTARTKREAGALLVELLHERDAGLERPAGKQTVGVFLERWLLDYAESSVAPTTLHTYRDIARRVLIPALGSVELTALRPTHVQALYSRLLREGRADGTGGLSPRSVGIAHQVLHAALHHAVKWQLLARNPADAVQRPRVPRRELTTVSAADVSRLLAVADATQIGPLARAGATWTWLPAWPTSSRRPRGSAARAGYFASPRLGSAGGPLPSRPRLSACWPRTVGRS